MDRDEIERETAAVIKQAARDGTLEGLTPRLVRRSVEERMGLDNGVLDETEHRAVVKAATEAAMENLHDASSEDDIKPQKAKPARPRKRKPSGENNTDDAKPRTKVKRKAESAPKPKKRAEKSPSKNNSKAKRSASVVHSSDEEGAGEGGKAGPRASTSREKIQPRKKAPKTVIESDKSESEVDSSVEPPKKRVKIEDQNEDHELPAADAGPGSKSPSRQDAGGDDDDMQVDTSQSLGKEKEDAADKSESETSVLIDEPPKRSQSGKGKAKATETDKKPKKDGKEKKERKQKQPAKELSKDEETIKRFKSLVVACGVRKVWSREFKDAERPSEQIKRLKEILTGLGMSGRMSMEQAKAIREKRELAKELEDVQNFEKSVVGAAERKRTAKSRDSEEGSDEDEEGAGLQKRKRISAHKSIMAFLGDQSESD